MQSFTVLSALFCIASAQLAAWPASSFNPYYQSILGPLRTPVNSIGVLGQGVAPSAIPAPPQVAAPLLAAPLPVAAPALPYAAPFAAPLAAAPFFAPPVAAPVASVFASPALPIAPRVVPAYAPFATSAMFIGSNKAKTA